MGIKALPAPPCWTAPPCLDGLECCLSPEGPSALHHADAIPYDELSDTEPEEEEAEGSPKKHPPSPACSNATQQFCSSEPSSLEPSPTKPEPEPKPAYDGPAMRTRSKTKHA